MGNNALIACAALLVSVAGSARPSGGPDPPTPWSRWTVFDGVPVHFIDSAPAADLPVLLLVPGYLGSGATFEQLVRLLQPGFRVVIPDLPGFGYSGVPAGACSLEYYAGFIERLRTHLGLVEFSLAGSSMGSLVVVRYAVDHPDRVKHLVLLSPFGAEGQAGLAERIDRLGPLLPLAVWLIRRPRLEAELRKQVEDASVLSPGIIESYWRPLGTRDGKRFVIRVTRSVVGRSTFDVDLPLLRLPVLVLAGTGDQLVEPRVLGLLEGTIECCAIQRLEGCRHLIYLDDPARVAGAIEEFCSSGIR